MLVPNKRNDCMMKIALCGNKKEIKQIEDILSQCFKGKKYEIHHVSSPLHIIRDYLSETQFKLFIISSKDAITYIINVYNNFDLKILRCISGKIEFPLTYEKINKNIAEKLKSSRICPYGAYVLRRKGEMRRILHKEIEYIHREKKKSVIYLNNGDSESLAKSTVKIAKELNKSYFIKCGKGYVINFFNIDKIDNSCKVIRMKSGAEIHMSRKGSKEFLKALSISVIGDNIFSY